MYGRIAHVEGVQEGHDHRFKRIERRVELVEETAAEHSDRLDKSDAKHEAHLAVVGEMMEVLGAWKSVKNTVSVAKRIGDTVKWLAVTGGAVGLLWAFVLRGPPT